MSTPVDSDDEELYLQPINYNATRDELIQALKAAQLSAMELLAENRQLRQENSQLRAKMTKKRNKDGEEDLLGYKKRVVGWAK
ncbi:hypothetical protein B0H19DRAFT_1264323 [Mycena capillaripes]|nr:hypothetical protein B0H19DRAFT_1264323 [Mycena capillaripes]